jgi:hypothetical protein
MIAWLFVIAIFMLQGVSRIQEWPTHRMPLPFALALSLLMIVLTQFLEAIHRPALLIMSVAVLADTVTTFVDVPSLIEGMMWISLAVLLFFYTYPRRSQLARARSAGWTWWKVLALIVTRGVFAPATRFLLGETSPGSAGDLSMGIITNRRRGSGRRQRNG